MILGVFVNFKLKMINFGSLIPLIPLYFAYKALQDVLILNFANRSYSMGTFTHCLAEINQEK